jgi:hypothetical protein
LVTVRKSQQSGTSILALAWCLCIADREPANVLYGVAGIDSLRDLNSNKLQPLIDAWHKHIRRSVIVPQTSRSGAGSTTRPLHCVPPRCGPIHDLEIDSIAERGATIHR